MASTRSKKLTAIALGLLCGGAAAWLLRPEASVAIGDAHDAQRARASIGAKLAGAEQQGLRAEPLRPRTNEAPILDPSVQQYDPNILALMKNLSVSEVFEQEPRSESWAPAMESLLTESLLADFEADFPDVEIEAITCKTASCRITMTAPDARADDAYSFLQVVAVTGSTLSPDLSSEVVDGRRRFGLDALFSPEIRSPGQFARWKDRTRDVREAVLRDFRERRGQGGSAQ